METQEIPNIDNNDNNENEETNDTSDKAKVIGENSNDAKVIDENNNKNVTEDIDGEAVEDQTNAVEGQGTVTVYRVERAVQKYKTTKKFDGTTNQILSSYLHFGGIAEDTTLSFSEDDPMIPNDMEVDFTYNVKVYLSSYIMNETGYVKEDAFREAPIVIESFLNYLVRRQVCPEYLEDMQQAINVAQLAKVELLNCKLLTQDASGKFNKACSLLFGGELYGRFDNPYPSEESLATLFGIHPEEAEQIVKKFFGDNTLNELTEVKEARKSGLTVEIIKVNELPESTTNDTTNNTEDDENDDAWLRSYYIREFEVRESEAPDAEPFTIAVGPELAPYPMVGMLIKADFHQLSNGFWYWDNTIYVYPSYYTKPEDSDTDE
ncbi:20497_t:CDS:2 [Dentiscutata erythropus]|uniref:20497_t:CDS:1 n=1 Tax=Dentiscutata erythropus TaxID=1348616 RepID=A0A9N8ZLF2_9GLOM|nr:20497_t:CDS:2 [Dentiscutata erythropus]